MDNKILLQDISQGVSLTTNIPKKDADTFVRNVFDIIIQYLQEDKIVKIKGLGTFKVIEVSGRDSVNVNTGERIHINGHSKISFTPDSSLRDIVNKPFVDFETIIINDGIDISEMERLPEIPVEEDNDQNDDINLVNTPENTSSSVIDDKSVDSTDGGIKIVESIPDKLDNNENSSNDQFIDVNTTMINNQPSEEKDIEINTDISVDNCLTEDNIPLEDNGNEVQNNEIKSTQSISVENNPQNNEIKKVNHTLSKVLITLLVLLLIVLSYLAGYNKWFLNTNVSDVQLITNEHVLDKPVIDHSNQNKSIENISNNSKPIAPKDSTVNSKDSLSQEKVHESPIHEVLPDGKYEVVGTKTTHILKAGEGLYRIARIYYGNMNMATYIIQHNQITNPDIVSEGTVLKIPSLTKIK